MREIEIKEGHDGSSYFWFQPVRLENKTQMIYDEDVIELKEEISIEEYDVDRFLAHFLLLYFDEESVYNKNRHECGELCYKYFEWNLVYNFYTYETMRAMLSDISNTADMLEENCEAPSLDKLKYHISRYTSLEETVDDIVDFYRRFVDRMTLMMENNPETFLISVMGP